MADDERDTVFLILGNQLFPPDHLEPYRESKLFMAEDVGLCTYVRHHQQKLVLFLSAMRSYRDALRERGFTVDYHPLDDDDSLTYEDRLESTIENSSAGLLIHFEIEDRFMDERIREFAEQRGIARKCLNSPMFLCSRDAFADYLDENDRVLMADFYARERKRLGILVDDDGAPDGGQWSYDEENRQKLPASVEVPEVATAASTRHSREVAELVRRRFHDHPGDAREFWWPTTRPQALTWLDNFLDERFAQFGPYEDAMSTRTDTVFHSLLSPAMNLGLITPAEIMERTLEHAGENSVPLASLEGFVRQVIGWREFVRGIYQNFGAEQEARNFWNHDRRLTKHWYAASTGIPPLDDAIGTATKLGWTHHIYRLMVVGNLMTLCEIRPPDAYRWFMEMYVDSSDWVMGPNVYGMGLFSDGGLFASKPYICGSNYMLKMSDYRKGDWCDTVDGLYWRFVDRHQEYFRSNPRVSFIPNNLKRMKNDRRKRIFAAAEKFLDRCTQQ